MLLYVCIPQVLKSAHHPSTSPCNVTMSLYMHGTA